MGLKTLGQVLSEENGRKGLELTARKSGYHARWIIGKQNPKLRLLLDDEN